MKNFNYYCNLHDTDKGDKGPNGNHYANWYENWFLSIKDKVNDVCEIGVDNNSSLLAMADYFPNANFIGLDLLDKSKFNTERITTQILDQGSTEHLNQFIYDCNFKKLQFDIIIDDGSHDVGHQQSTFGKFFQLIKPGGIYIIEDMGSSYLVPNISEMYGNIQTQLKSKNNTIDFLNDRPFNSFWISNKDIDYINKNIDYVSIFDRVNPTCTYSHVYVMKNNYPLRSITSIIKKLNNEK
tara:strand:- start:2085 stop:2801 length:717 start_codon:yes stop_codon:yes gene_type:complete